jgi:parallel beta helix pectate lyase-like protein
VRGILPTVAFAGLVSATVLTILGLGATSAAPPATPRADGPPVVVRDEASFRAALASARGGETIQLVDGAYPQLSVLNRRFDTPVRIVGSRAVTLAGIAFHNSSNVVLEGVTVTPPAKVAAEISVKGSSQNVVIMRVRVDGRDERVGAFVSSEAAASDVTVQGSELTNCGYKGGCIRPGARNLRVVDNRFYDCRSCTFIKGGGNGAYVQGNTFDLAHNVGCTRGHAGCPHNDHIHIMGGGPWTIVGNWFGDYEAGAAQLYANPGLTNDANPIRDVLIASNIFVDESGLAVRIGVGDKSPTPPPSNVRVVNNTILTGGVGGVGALLLPDTWRDIPADKLPIIANNIFHRFSPGNCDRATFVSNLVFIGKPCSLDSKGDPKLDAKTAAPTTASALVVDKADPQYAPKTDFYGRPRSGPPDRGAIELVRSAAAAPHISVPSTLGRRAAALARDRWRLVVSVGVRNADTLRGRLLKGGKTLAAVSAPVTGKARHLLVIPLPAAARGSGVLVLRLEAVSSGRSAVRSVTVRIFG